MKKNGILILLCFAMTVSIRSVAYNYTDTTTTAPTAYFAEDSLPKRIGHVNPISTLAAISAIAAPLVAVIGHSGNGFGFDPLLLSITLFLVGFVGGIIGFAVRNKLLAGQYASYPQPRKLPLGQGRSAIGIFGTVLVTVLIVLVGSCG